VTALVIDGLHRLGIPNWLEWVWRGVLLLVAVALLGMCWTFVRAPDQPTSRKLFMAAVMVMLGRWIVVNVERADGPIFLEGVPVDTIWMGLMLWGMRAWVRERQR
jgi:hypothetical protein